MDRFVARPSFVLLFPLLIVLCAGTVVHASPSIRPLRIGILLDVEKEATLGFIRQLEIELSSLLQSRYTVSIDSADILRCNWSADCVENNYRLLVENPMVDIILGLGPLNGALLTRRPVYPKPVIVVGVIDPALQKIPITPDGTSGVHNLTFVMFPQSLEADLETFYTLTPYKRIALIEDRRLLERFPWTASLTTTLADRGVDWIVIGVDSPKDAEDERFDAVDAVIIGSLYRFEERDRAKLIEKMNELKLPTFSIKGVDDVRLGALAATRPETDFPRLIRRVALNIERILDGEDPAALPLTFQRKENLHINMTTARRIGFSPSWDILMEAELVQPEPSADSILLLGLKDTIAQALAANRTLAAQRQAHQSKEEDVALARTPLFPQVGVSAGGRVIDEEHAIGGATERAVSGTAKLDQMIFSESLLTNLSVSRHELFASRYSLDQTELDTVQTSGVAYFDILRARTNRRIRKDYLDLVKENLGIARKRLAVGYAGAADVYRWERELASAKNSLIEAHATWLATKQRLNQILYRPIDKPFSVADVRLSDNLFHQYPKTDLRKYVNNPAAMKLAADFLVQEATATLPEIKEVDEAILANERVLTSYRRKRYLPDVAASAQADHIFSRTGAGSDAALPNEDSWQVGVNASWSLFPGGEISVRTRQLKIDISRLKTQRTDLIQGLELTLRNNLLDIVAKSFNITLSQQAADAGAKNFDLVQDAYEKGQVPIVQLLDAQNAALTSKLTAANAVYEYFISYLNLDRSMGRFLLLTPEAQQAEFFNRLIEYLDEKREQ